MDKSIQNIIVSLFGAIFVPVFEFMYGEGDVVKYLMTALLFFVVMDWITGVRAAKKDETYASKYGIDGIFRTFFILLLPAGGHFLDMIAGTNGLIFGALGAGVLYHIIQSMTANALRAGWGDYFPEWLLVKLTEWVKEELESKLSRSESRKNTKVGEGK
ncbi:phage holin family protein [Oceanobacillus caeni]|uniref:phage holin family protein n=1 Tax=Oceanobacillus caeni TaxID=405946 RepID=UPI002149A56B|nr:phage holin family protein [Oceanobacillus caeni]MCR1833047.1 phage holin family protein [Oceanobacillus caeni]